MKAFQQITFSPSKCKQELVELKQLLDSKTELSERDDILPFFRAHQNVAAFVGSYNAKIAKYDLLAFELDICGLFKCDLVVGCSARRHFHFVEFEDGRPQSIFSKKATKATSEWSGRLEHGFSQVIDWFYAMDDNRDSIALVQEVFGVTRPEYTGMVALGRHESMSPLERSRLGWRMRNVLVHARSVECVSLDQLYEDLSLRLDSFSIVGS